MTQRIAVVGANNFVGRRIVSSLARTSWATPIAADSRFDPAGGHPVGSEMLVSREGKSWDALLSNCDGVISCTMGSPESIIASMQSLTAAMERRSRPLRLVHVSSMTVYGSATGIVDESQQPVGQLTAYAAARLESEQLTRHLADVITLRPGCEYGPGCVHWSERIAQWLIARRLGDLGAAGDGYCNLTYIDDLAQAALRALEVPDTAGQTFNIATDCPPTWNEYFMRFALALRAVPVRRVTSRRLRIETKVMAVPLKIAEMVAARFGVEHSPFPPAIPASLPALCSQDIRLDVSRAAQRLGMRWTAISEGLGAAAGSAARAGG